MGICGLEPQTSSLSVTRSNQLSYIPSSLSLFYPIFRKKSTLNLPYFPKMPYNILMDWNFSIGWMITGLIILAASGAVVANYQKISDTMLSGVSSYDRVKFWGMIGVGLGLAVMANLHTLILTFFVNLVFKR